MEDNVLETVKEEEEEVSDEEEVSEEKEAGGEDKEEFLPDISNTSDNLKVDVDSTEKICSDTVGLSDEKEGGVEDKEEISSGTENSDESSVIPSTPDETEVIDPYDTQEAYPIDKLQNLNSESHEFKAEISQLMNLIINTFYSNKDIFLRELISNASDALDKVRFKHLQSGNMIDAMEYNIKITPYKKQNLLVIEDTGIGMSKSELESNLGTIANSGTKRFMESLKNSQNKDVDLIGQFGVGFYSAYLVSDRVQVISKSNESEVYMWDSDASGSYKISELKDVDDMKQGTKIILHLKESESDYCDEHKLKEIVKTHSQFISHNIHIQTFKQEIVKEDEVEDEDEKEGIVQDVTDDQKSIEKKEWVASWELLNKDKPIWAKSPKDVSDDEYKSLYKNISNDYQDCLCYKHFNAEGSIEFSGIIYIPASPPFDMFQTNKEVKNIKLYVKRVFIMDNCEDLVPDWLSFIRGLVDCSDLPLNVSREMLQHNKIIRIMKKKIISKTVELLDDISKDEEKFNKFYHAFSKNLKLGIYEEEEGNKQKLARFLRFYSNKSKDKLRSLEDYISEFQPDQKTIYYITGESKEFVENSVFLETLTSKNYEVLYLIEPIDEYMTQNFKKYSEYEFVSVTKEGLKLDNKEVNKEDNELCAKIKNILSDKVEKVVVSDRIVNSPCCLVTGEYGMSANMERIMKAQALGDNNQRMFMSSKKVMEINPEHKIIKALKSKFDKDKDDFQARDIVILLYDISCVSSGFTVDNVNTFSKKFHNILEVGLGCDQDDIDEDLPDLTELPTDSDDSQMEQVD